jgi:hypothetical protein
LSAALVSRGRTLEPLVMGILHAVAAEFSAVAAIQIHECQINACMHKGKGRRHL